MKETTTMKTLEYMGTLGGSMIFRDPGTHLTYSIPWEELEDDLEGVEATPGMWIQFPIGEDDE